jgi:hypothetical protein
VILNLNVARFMNRRVSLGRERETGGRAIRQRRTTAARRAIGFQTRPHAPATPVSTLDWEEGRE